ncbi:MAG: hypothetical protein AABP62_26610 [Planctomycetota bacterium]
MTSAIVELIASFERLSDAERTEAVVEILRRSPNIVSPAIGEDEFLAAQVETFLELDTREVADEFAKKQ